MRSTHSLCIAFLAMVMVAFLGCAPQKSAKEELGEKNKALANQLYDGLNAHDWDKLSTLFAPDFADHGAMPGQKPGFEGLKEMFSGMRAAIPDMKITPLQIVVEGDLVAARMTFSGTPKSEFAGIPPSGKSFSIEGYDLIRISEGKCVEHWGIMDQFGMMMQLGAIQPPGQPPTKK